MQKPKSNYFQRRTKFQGPRTNERIRSLDVQVINSTGENLGVLPIKKAIETIFKVKVNKVNTSILRGKGKTFKGQYGFRKDTKKAIVTLDEGNTIDSSLEIK